MNGTILLLINRARPALLSAQGVLPAKRMKHNGGILIHMYDDTDTLIKFDRGNTPGGVGHGIIRLPFGNLHELLQFGLPPRRDGRGIIFSRIL